MYLIIIQFIIKLNVKKKGKTMLGCERDKI